MSENQLSHKIIGCAMKVHSKLGPGLLESSYEECLFYELQHTGLGVIKQKALPLVYNDVKLEVGYRIDLLVENKIIVEVKAVDAFNDVHLAQVLEANEITYLIRGAAFRVHTALGPGLLESVYEAALKYELQRDGLRVRNQVGIPMIYGEIKFDLGFRLDLLVEEQVIVEIKSVEILNDVHFKQLMTYLRLSNKQLNSDYS
jgi:GxxExxY protein